MKIKIEHALEFYMYRLEICKVELQKSEARWLRVKDEKSKSMSQWFDRFVCKYIVGKPYEYQPRLWADWEYFNYINDARSLDNAKNNMSGVRYKKSIMGEQFHELPDEFVPTFLKWWEDRKDAEYQKLKEEYDVTD